LYREYKSAAQFIKDEDLRAYRFRRTKLKFPKNKPSIKGIALRGARNTIWAWIYSPNIVARHIGTQGSRSVERLTQYFEKKVPINGQETVIPDLTQGTYRVEFWNTYTGTILTKKNITVASRREDVTIALPDFKNDIALKIYKPSFKKESSAKSTSSH
jgi:hypothetical protein